MKAAFIALLIYILVIVYFLMSRDLYFSGGSVQVPVKGFGIVFKITSLIFYLVSIGMFIFSLVGAIAGRFRKKWLNLLLISSLLCLGYVVMHYMRII